MGEAASRPAPARDGDADHGPAAEADDPADSATAARGQRRRARRGDAGEADDGPLPPPPPLLEVRHAGLAGLAGGGRDERAVTLDEIDVETSSEADEDEEDDLDNSLESLSTGSEEPLDASRHGDSDDSSDGAGMKHELSSRRKMASPPESPQTDVGDTEDWTRTIGLGEDASSQHSNAVHTTKYTMWSFLPRSFLLQYRRAGNIFFTVVVLVMLMGSYSNLFDSPQKPWGNVFVLTIIFGLNMTSEFLDDRARARKDDTTNAQPVHIYDRDRGDFSVKTWREVRRGDLIRLEKNSTCPADLLVLTTSDIDTEQCCYVQTANIDGETYLKKRHCKKEVVDRIDNSVEATVDWLEDREIRYEPPTSSLSNFKILVMPKRAERLSPLSFSSDNVVLRGAELCNTEWVLGVVLYTGSETKTLMSISSGRIKQSKVDRMVNQVIITVLVMLALLLVVSVVLSTFAYQPTTELWYMKYSAEAAGNIFPAGLALLLTYLVLYRQILPILLYAVQEGLNVAQAKYIGWDLNMFDEASGKFASCNTTSLAQEIGQVKWIFSDKTGTLTRNEMRLVAISVNKRVYGCATNKALEELAREELSPLQASRRCFGDALDALVYNSEPGERERLRHFFTVLALCHTVLVEGTSANRPIKDSTRLLRRSSLTAKSGSMMRSNTLESTISADGMQLAMKKKSPNQRRIRMSLKSRKHASEIVLKAQSLEGDPELTPDEAGTPSPLKDEPTDEADKSDEEADESVPVYNAESPDEEALVLGACALGFEFAYTEGESTIGLRLRSAEIDTRRQTYGAPRGSEDIDSASRTENVYRLCDARGARYQGYEVLAINPFTSDRKRMSVLYADPENPGRKVLYCKGADNQMLNAANPDTTDYESIRAELKSFSENGLRTLIVGEREISDEEYESWSQLHEHACSLTGKERKAKLDEVAKEIEVNLTVLGLTAVEDRLQDGVPQTISILRAAKINIWLITGDKVETAINIGRSAELLNQNSRLLMLTAEALGITDEQRTATILPADGGERVAASAATQQKDRWSEGEIQTHLLSVIRERLSRTGSNEDNASSRPSMSGFSSHGQMYRKDSFKRDSENRGIVGCFMRLCNRKLRHAVHVNADPSLAMVVDGDTLHHIISKKHHNAELEAAFLHLARTCSVVIACRTSPGQKAELVDLVKTNVYPTPTTLAIGDGANDVPMIEKGHVGVGISGKEGTHAANAADFTIGQFKFLAPLLLVHGRFGYIRVAKAISLTFFANLLFTFVSFFYNFICRFSGTPAFNNAQYVIFQAFIAVPVFAIGFLDRDTKGVYDTLRSPRSYDIGRLNRILHPAIVDAQILRGLVHGALAFLLVFYNDYDASYLALSGSLFVVITCVLTMRQVSVASAYTWLLLFGACFNIIGCLVLVSIINFFYSSGGESNIFDLQKWGRYYWNQLVASVFIISLLDYLAPLTYTQLRDMFARTKHAVRKKRLAHHGVSGHSEPRGRGLPMPSAGPATPFEPASQAVEASHAGEASRDSGASPVPTNDLLQSIRAFGLSVVSEGDVEDADLESVRSARDRDRDALDRL